MCVSVDSFSEAIGAAEHHLLSGDVVNAISVVQVLWVFGPSDLALEQAFNELCGVFSGAGFKPEVVDGFADELDALRADWQQERLLVAAV